MPDIFSIILFPNAHNLLVVFLYISAIIPNLCSKNLINSIDSVSLMARGACFKRERIDGTLESLMLLLVLLVEGPSSNSVSLGSGSGQFCHYRSTTRVSIN